MTTEPRKFKIDLAPDLIVEAVYVERRQYYPWATVGQWGATIYPADMEDVEPRYRAYKTYHIDYFQHNHRAVVTWPDHPKTTHDTLDHPWLEQTLYEDAESAVKAISLHREESLAKARDWNNFWSAAETRSKADKGLLPPPETATAGAIAPPG